MFLNTDQKKLEQLTLYKTQMNPNKVSYTD